MRAALALATLTLVACAAAPTGSAWVGESPGSHHEMLALLAAARLPPEERAFIDAHREAFARGAWEPDANVNTFYHSYEPADHGGGGLHQVEQTLYDATMGLRENASADEVAYRLGALTHFTLDLSVPFHTGPDLYDHGWHLPYERSAAVFHDELAIRPARDVRELDDPRAAALALAELSANRSGALLATLDAANIPWTPEARTITGELISEGVDVTADMLHTAFARAQPGRPAPQPPADQPVPQDAEDVGLGRGDIRQWVPWEGALLLGMATMAVLWAISEVIRRRRRQGSPDR